MNRSFSQRITPTHANIDHDSEYTAPAAAPVRHEASHSSNSGGASAVPATTLASQRLYTVDEACAVLRIKRTLFYSLLAQRRIQSILIGSRRVIPAEAIEAFIHEQLEEEAF